MCVFQNGKFKQCTVTLEELESNKYTHCRVLSRLHSTNVFNVVAKTNPNSWLSYYSEVSVPFVSTLELLPRNAPIKNTINTDSEYSQTTDLKGKKRALTDEHYNSDSDAPSSSKKTRDDSVEILTTASGSTASDDVVMKDT